MNDEQLLRAVGKEINQAERPDERLLERYAANELSDDELNDLEVRAAADPDFAARCELYRPLTESEAHEVVERHEGAGRLTTSENQSPRSPRNSS